jgi:hypothetical protein
MKGLVVSEMRIYLRLLLQGKTSKQMKRIIIIIIIKKKKKNENNSSPRQGWILRFQKRTGVLEKSLAQKKKKKQI